MLFFHLFPPSQVICHGIPDRRPLESGDIVNVDVSVYKDGYHGDLNETFVVGEVDEEGKKLVKVTHEVSHRWQETAWCITTS